MGKSSLKPSVLFARIASEGILADLDSGRLYGLNETGARIVEFLAREISAPEMVEELRKEFHLTSDICRAEIAAFIAALANANLLGDSPPERPEPT